MAKDLEYRADIDGLRALAVMSVILFHVGCFGFGGGFVGVDIFFVISGYLITKIIYTQQKNGGFSFREFYARRVRRLLPALLFTLLISFVAGALILSPKHFEQMSGSLLFGLFSASNFFFLGEVGYFDTAATYKPLLHTWSLAIEEQFYIVWPVILLLYMKLKNPKLKLLLLGGMAAGVLLSFALAVIFESSKSSFYFTPFRVYEFFMGIALVFLPEVKKAAYREVMFTAGLILMICAVTLFDSHMLFPSYLALIPTLGAALVIYARNPPVTGIVLRNKFCVRIGAISYSLYLVHWPILVYLNYMTIDASASLGVIVVALSFLCAVAMYYYIEQPFRRQKNHVFYRNFKIIIPVLFILLAVLSLHAWQTNGWAWRFSAVQIEAINKSLIEDTKASDVFYDEHNVVPPNFEAKGKKNLFVVGDSHSRDVFNALATNQDKIAGYNIFHLYLDEKCFERKNYTPTLARRILGVHQKDNDEECANHMQAVKNSAFAKKADIIIIATATSEDQSDDEIDRMPNEVAFHRRNSPHARIIIFGVKRLPFDPPTFYLLKDGSPQINAQIYGLNRSKRSYINELVREAAHNVKATYFDFYSLLCNNATKKCLATDEQGNLLYDDDNHWTFAGEKYFGKLSLENGLLSSVGDAP